ncbi:MAG: hypothetical protein MZV49_21490 [Rhodopseudomonas palustris]|nr:hypothetical protein [Rhodopseudomonas palustris]
MIANSSPKKSGAISANSTAAEALRLRRKRRSIVPEAEEAVTLDIDNPRCG